MRSPGENSGPLNIKKQLAFAFVLFVVMALANLAKKFWGDTAFLAVSFVSGLFELQGVTFAISSMEFSENVMWAIALAFIASLVSKASILMSVRHTHVMTRGVWLGSLVLLAVCFFIPLLFFQNLEH